MTWVTSVTKSRQKGHRSHRGAGQHRATTKLRVSLHTSSFKHVRKRSMCRKAHPPQPPDTNSSLNFRSEHPWQQPGERPMPSPGPLLGPIPVPTFTPGSHHATPDPAGSSAGLQAANTHTKKPTYVGCGGARLLSVCGGGGWGERVHREGFLVCLFGFDI